MPTLNLKSLLGSHFLVVERFVGLGSVTVNGESLTGMVFRSPDDDRVLLLYAHPERGNAKSVVRVVDVSAADVVMVPDPVS